MRISHFFIDRPIFAGVISIVFVIIGAVALGRGSTAQPGQPATGRRGQAASQSKGGQTERHGNRDKVWRALEAALSKDKAKTTLNRISELGLIEMTRKRTRESLAHQLCAPCAACEGRGYVKTPETVCYEIFREILRQTGQFEFQELLVLAHQDVIERLLDEESAALGELEVLTGKPIRLQTEALYLIDQYDVVLM